jgi:hypothetical protein
MGHPGLSLAIGDGGCLEKKRSRCRCHGHDRSLMGEILSRYFCSIFAFCLSDLLRSFVQRPCSAAGTPPSPKATDRDATANL